MKKYLTLMLCGLMGIGCAQDKNLPAPPPPPRSSPSILYPHLRIFPSEQNPGWKEIDGDTWSIQVPKYFEQQDSSKFKSAVGMEFVMTDNYGTLLVFENSQVFQNENELDFSDDFIQTLKQQPDMKVLDVQWVSLSDKTAIVVLSSYKDEMYVTTYLLISNQIGYAFSCAAPTEKMSKKIYLCEKIAATLTVK